MENTDQMIRQADKSLIDLGAISGVTWW